MAPQNCHPDRSEAQWRDLLFHSDQQQIPTLHIPLANLQVMTTFPTCLWQVEKEMTLQNRHGSEARRAGSQTSAQPGGLGDGSPRLRSDDVAESMPQPFRAGLILAAGPPGLGNCRFSSGSHAKKKTPISVTGMHGRYGRYGMFTSGVY